MVCSDCARETKEPDWRKYEEHGVLCDDCAENYTDHGITLIENVSAQGSAWQVLKYHH